MRVICLILAMHFLLFGWAQATQYILPTLEQSTATSDFVGIVECIMAGGIVARYRVVESWKGADIGTEQSIRQFVDPYGREFPTSLIGERFLVFASKSVQVSVTSMSFGGNEPLWWRWMPSDLHCFDMTPVSAMTQSYSKKLRKQHVTIEDFKKAVITFLRSDIGTQELHLMLSVARDRLNLATPGDPGTPEDNLLYAELTKARSVEELWGCIIDQAKKIELPPRPKAPDDPKQLPPPWNPRNREDSLALRRMMIMLDVIEAGRERAKALLEKTDFATLPWEKRDLAGVLNRMRENLSPSKKNRPLPAQKHEPSEQDLKQAQEQLTKPWTYQHAEAFDLLCRHAPELLVKFLQTWPSTKEEQYRQSGYQLGSAFGHWCEKARETHLLTLCDAKDDWIKTAAAVYLCFDDLETGKQQLRKMMDLKGDPGAWAAVVLVSRGERTAALRAIEQATAIEVGEQMSSTLRILQKRLLVLLSNSAARSGVPQPPVPTNSNPFGTDGVIMQRQFTEALKAWWNTHKDKIVLHDPWLEMLEKQKVD